MVPTHEYVRVWMMLPVCPVGHELVCVSGEGWGAVQEGGMDVHVLLVVT